MWEYLIVVIHHYDDESSGLEILGQPYNHAEGSYKKGEHHGRVQEMMNRLGKVDWEFVSETHDTLKFKRPKQ